MTAPPRDAAHAARMRNDIVERQDRPELLKLLRAKTAAYDHVQRWYYGQIAAVVVVPLIMGVLKSLSPASAALVPLVSLLGKGLDFWGIEPRQKAARKDAARLQEVYDCELLRLPWNEVAAGRQPEPAVVERWAAKHPSVAHLRGWYRREIEPLPLPLARFAAQRMSAQWSASMRERYARLLQGVAIAVPLALGLVAYAREATVPQFMVLALTVSPLWEWAFKEARRQRESVDKSAKVGDYLTKQLEKPLGADVNDATLRELELAAREVQTIMFHQRASDPQVPSPMYWRYREAEERDAQANVVGIVAVQRQRAPANGSG